MEKIEDNQLVVSREPGWVVIHATQIDVENLVNVGRIIGVIE